MPRLFVAVDLVSELRQEIEAMCTGVSQARWANPHQLHITLRFLGNTPADALPEIRHRLATVNTPDFYLSLRGVGVFPDKPGRQRPRVLWLGIEPIDRLAFLKRAIDQALRALGFDDEATNRPFAPHLTLARFSKPTDASLSSFLLRHRSYRSATWHVDCFRLYQSHLHSSGSTHIPIEAYPLAHEGSAG